MPSEIYGAVFQATSNGVSITDADATILAVNEAFSRITGYREEEVLGRTPRILQSGRHDPEYYRSMWAALTGVGHWEGEIWNRAKGGRVYPEYLSIDRFESAGQAYYVAVFRDISAQRERAFVDPLTGLPNRARLEDRLQQHVLALEREGAPVAVLMMDLDRFKPINDTLGHLAGDRVLEVVARRLRGAVRRTDTVGRFGGDEFLLVGAGTRDRGSLQRAGERIAASVATPMHIVVGDRDHDVSLGISIGGIWTRRPGVGAAEVIEAADAAMYAVKRAGGGVRVEVLE